MRWQELHEACWAGDAVEVQRLLEAGANANQIAPTDWRQTPLGRTLEFRITHPKHAGHIETVRTLLAHGADPLVRSTTLDMTPYELATFCGLEGAAELLREFRGAAAHPCGMTDLWLAAASRLDEERQLAVVRELVDRADVNAPFRGATPLMMAAGHSAHLRIAELLLDAGADPNAGTSMLHVDWHLEHLIPALGYLARAGWDVNLRDGQGQTALHRAALYGYSAVIRALLALHADQTIRDASGGTALDIARRRGKAAAVKALSLAA